MKKRNHFSCVRADSLAIFCLFFVALSLTVCGDGPPPQAYIDSANVGRLMYIEPGTFTMGSPEAEANLYENEGPQHQVTLTKGFYMGRYAVTQKQYKDIMGENPSYFSVSGSGSASVTGLDTDDFPVEYVTWYDAVEFCNKLSTKEGLEPVYTITARTPEAGYPITSATVNANFNKNGYRLPTEAEWEYACRAGTTTPFNWGTSVINDTKANYYASYVDAYNTTAGTDLNRTSAVGDYAANAWGLYDMHGNVFEWCWDWYGAEYYTSAPASDPKGPATGVSRVLRGGSWGGDGRYLRSAIRGGSDPSSRYVTFGFRLVRNE